MKTSNHFLFAAAFVVLAALCSGAMAQGSMGQVGSAFRLPPVGSSTVTVNAIEVTDGTLGLDSRTKNETLFGYSFLGRTSGSLPGSFTLSMNCTPAIPTPGVVSELTGGAWTLPVYLGAIKGGGYAGSLYGTVDKGSMNWDKTETGANVYMVLSVNGGTQSWDGAQGYAIFVGTLSVDEKTRKTTLNGDLVITILNAVKD